MQLALGCLVASAALTFSPAQAGQVADWPACLASDHDAAIAACGKLAAPQLPRELRALALYDRGNAWRHKAMVAAATQGDEAGAALEHALDDYGKAIALRPDLAEAHVNRGIVWFMKNDYRRAIADDDAAIALRPELAVAWNNRCLAWYKLGRLDFAQRDFDQTIRLEKNFGNALINREMDSIVPER